MKFSYRRKSSSLPCGADDRSNAAVADPATRFSPQQKRFAADLPCGATDVQVPRGGSDEGSALSERVGSRPVHASTTAQARRSDEVQLSAEQFAACLTVLLAEAS
jgi:hypothetical protein